MPMYRFLRQLFIPIFLMVGIGITAQSDSILIEFKKIKEKNTLLTLKDSIRAAIVKEELDNIVSPKSKELNQYKKELQKIKSEDSLRLAQQKATIDQLREDAEPHPVTFFHKTLFNFYSGLGPFSAKDRAINAQVQIQNVFDKKVYFQDSLKIQSSQDYLNIMYKDDIITSVSQEDALWMNMTQDSLAVVYRDIINSSIEESRINHTFESVALRWLTAIAIIIGFIALVYFVRKMFRWVIRKLVLNTEVENPGIKINNYQFINPRQLKVFLVKVLKWLHVLVFFFLLSVAISFIFSVFPATENWAYLLIHWILDPIKDLGKSLYHYLPNLFRIAVILLIGRYVDKLLKYFSSEIEKGILTIKGFHTDWAKPTYHLLRIFLIGFVLIMIFPYLPGSDTSAFRGISVFFGVILSLGSSSTIANTIAGFIITYMRPFQIGDWIKVNDVTGEVLEKTALVTRLRTINNEDITVPNSMILTNKTTNYSSSSPEKGLILNADIYVKYDVPFITVNHLLIKAALETEGILAEPKPYVFKNKIAETNVLYQLNATTMLPEKMYFIKSDLNENILRVFSEAGIDLMTPQYYTATQK